MVPKFNKKFRNLLKSRKRNGKDAHTDPVEFIDQQTPGSKNTGEISPVSIYLSQAERFFV